MGRKSAKSLKMAKLSKLAAEKRSSRNETRNAVALHLEQVNGSGAEVDIVIPETQSQESIIVSWNKKAEDAIRKYSRSGSFSARHIRRLKKKSRDNARGTRSIKDWLTAPTISSTSSGNLDMEELSSDDEVLEGTTVNASDNETTETMQAALEELGSFATPVPNAKSVQQTLGHYQMVKYEGVYHYLSFRVSLNLKKMEASRLASDLVYKQKSTIYKARKIRDYAAEYLERRLIAPGSQGKHSKRVSVLDDEDLKRKILHWFRSQPKAKRSIALLKNQLTEVILPQAIESNTLNSELLADRNEVINPLSDDCLRRKLISWGFHFQRLGTFCPSFIFINLYSNACITFRKSCLF